MNIQLLVALQEFVQEVSSSARDHTSEFPIETELERKADKLDSLLHAHIEAENAKLNTLEDLS